MDTEPELSPKTQKHDDLSSQPEVVTQPDVVQPEVQPESKTGWKARLTSFRTKVHSKLQKLTNWCKTKCYPVWNQAQRFLPASNTGRARSRRTMVRLSQDRKKLFYMKLLRFAAFGGVIAVVGGIIGFFVLFAWFSRDLPKPGEVVRRDGFSTKLFDKNGELLFDLYNQERRTPVAIDTVPQHVKDATIAIEDKDFYKHRGFDMLTIVRIPYNAIVRQRVVGGSTLTQQLVKNALLTNERSVQRKFKELVLSMQIERTFSKDEILEMYLNEAPYGGTAWGIGTAAEVYFDKEVPELTMLEGAILAGLPQRPTAYSPFTGKTDDDGEPLWQLRTKGVLRRMLEDSYISQEQHDQALADLPNVEFASGSVQMRAPHFVFYVRDQLAEMYGEEVVETAGFKVTTSLDLEIQEEAEKIVREEVEKVVDLNITNGSAMVMDPDTGEIVSMVGSVDFYSEDIDGQFNVAVDGLRQPGSSIKPVTYVTLLQRGYTPASMLADVKTSFQSAEGQDAYEPNNYDGKFRGPVSVRNSLGSSLNVPAVKALALVGLDSFLNQAYDMGFVTLEPTRENKQRFGLAVTLGGAEVHLIDTMTAYSAFANYGRRVEPVSILKVEDADGNVIYEHRDVEGPRVLPEGAAFLINHILSDNNARAIAFGTRSLLNVSPAVAVKTGTTNDQRDNWAIGWSQEVVVGAWVGNNDNSAMKQVASGVSGATPIWRRIMLLALDKGYSAPAWEVPEDVESIALDTISGYPAHDDFPSREEYALRGNVPSLPDPIHTKLKVCKGDESKLAPAARVARGDFEDREFIVLQEDDPLSTDGVNRWQAAIDAWVAGQDDGRYKYPTEYCGDAQEIYVTLKEPKNETKYDGDNITVEVEADSQEGIEKIEIWVNGNRRETINNRTYKGSLNLPKGRYEIYAKAYSRDGKDKQSNTVKIGTGGEDWKQPDPSPTPSPSPSPSPSPVVSPPALPIEND